MRNIRNKSGFTLVELLVAMVVTGVVLSAVATLAFAMSSASKSSDNISRKQAEVRYATLRIQELIRNSRLICSASNNEIALWRADDNDDNFPDLEELTYIELGSNRIRILDLTNSPSGWNDTFKQYYKDRMLEWIQTGWFKPHCGQENADVITECSNIQVSVDLVAPLSEYISISFNLTENNISHTYHISATLRSRADNLITPGGYYGYIFVSDDD